MSRCAGRVPTMPGGRSQVLVRMGFVQLLHAHPAAWTNHSDSDKPRRLTQGPVSSCRVLHIQKQTHPGNHAWQARPALAASPLRRRYLYRDAISPGQPPQQAARARPTGYLLDSVSSGSLSLDKGHISLPPTPKPHKPYTLNVWMQAHLGSVFGRQPGLQSPVCLALPQLRTPQLGHVSCPHPEPWTMNPHI